jgi:WD40-like Beta Propeller Repeat
MTAEQWQTLSSWHNAWLAEDPVGRDRLRRQLSELEPEISSAAERLITDARPLKGFLETPALVLAAGELAATYATTPETAAPLKNASSRRTLRIAGALALGLLGGAIGWHLRPPQATERPSSPLVRFTVALPVGVDVLSAPTLSPDGQRIVFVGGTPAASRLIVRDLGNETTTAMEGTDGARFPFWSPDGGWIGFSARGRLMKVPRTGGAPVVIDGAVGSWGGAWSSSGVVVYQPAVRNAGLLRVPDGGGRSAPASILDDAVGDVSHRFPAMLPDGRSFLYYLESTHNARRGMYLARLDASAAKATASSRLGTFQQQASYVAVTGETGFLLSAAGARLEARPVDPARMQVGEPFAIDIGAVPATQNSPVMFTATADVLAYAASGGEPSSRAIGIVVGWRRLARRP